MTRKRKGFKVKFGHGEKFDRLLREREVLAVIGGLPGSHDVMMRGELVFAVALADVLDAIRALRSPTPEPVPDVPISPEELGRWQQRLLKYGLPTGEMRWHKQGCHGEPNHPGDCIVGGPQLVSEEPGFNTLNSEIGPSPSGPSEELKGLIAAMRNVIREPECSEDAKNIARLALHILGVSSPAAVNGEGK